MNSSAVVYSIIGVVVAGFVANMIFDLLDKGKYKYYVEKVVFAIVITISATTIIQGIRSAYSIMDVVR